MADSPAPDLAWLLRSWRTSVARLPLSIVAERLGVGASAVSNWELDPSRLRHLDEPKANRLIEAYGRVPGRRGSVEPALRGLVEAIGTPAALSAAPSWWHNYPPRVGPRRAPAWAWFRPPAGCDCLKVVARWGPVYLEVEKRCDQFGFILTAPSSTHNPPVHVDVDPPGWVDFGTGRVSPGLGIPVEPAIGHVHLREVARNLWGAKLDRLAAFLKMPSSKALFRLFADEQSLRDANERVDELGVLRVATSAGCRPTQGPRFTGRAYERLRVARRLTAVEAARQANALRPAAHERIKEVDVYAVESGGRPRIPPIWSRLDAVYRAHGLTCIEDVPIARDKASGSWVAEFPDYWVGPVWLWFEETTSAETVVELTWLPWSVKLVLGPKALVWFRRSRQGAGQLEVVPSAPTRIKAGMGIPPGATDGNDGWIAADRYAMEVFTHMRPIYEAMRRELRQLLQMDEVA